ncbi:exocyst complex component Sec5-domain-containing protein [Catenaria anguillulae PL171]|uniref:Exocyst complex component SEC5 n=1 Tax=Catenaria anguillulae PL171 TaxID=765915 RepID=A0A1Y2HEG2_9FUNG|nr:exocyst complex component Sec5-domain-containing protein [Catenaria anguillulae PL171]
MSSRMPPAPTPVPDPYGGPLSPGSPQASTPNLPVISERELLTLYGLESMDTDRWVDLDPIAPPSDQQQQQQDAAQQPSAPASRAGSQSNLTGGTAPNGNQLYLDDTDPLRLKPSIFRSLPRSLPNVTRDHLCIAHKDFDPKKFLSTVHANASFRDLDYGLSQLLDTNDEHAAGMRTLVRSHFDDFVVAKSTVDEAFRGWTERELDPATHYGTDAFSDTLDIATSTVKQVFGPILDRRRQAERIKSTLAVLERFKFFFNLPAGLRAHVSAGRWIEAVRDYKKGKALMAGMYPDVVAANEGGGIGGAGFRAAAAVPAMQQKMLFETIWNEVVRVMATLQDRLMRQLTEQHAARSADEQEAAIALVLDIDPAADPVWAYLESRFKWILSQLKERVSMWYREMPLNTAKPERFTEAQFRRAVHLRNKKEYDVLFAKDPEVQAWAARTALIADLTQTLVHSLPDFWKLGKGYIEGKYASKTALSSNPLLSTPGAARGRGGGGTGGGRGFAALDLVKVEQCHKMVKDMAGYFGMLIQHSLALNSPAAASGANSAASPASPASPRPPVSPLPPGLVLPGSSSSSLTSLPMLPPLTCVNSVTVGVYAPRMAAHMHACADAIRSVKVPPDTLTSVVAAMERAKAGVLEMLVGAWMADVKVLPGIEDWRLEGGGAAPAPARAAGMVQAAFKVARPLTPPGAPATEAAGGVSVTGAKLGSLIVPAFFESTVLFLDAMHALVATDPASAGASAASKKLTFPATLPAADHWTWLALHVTCNLDHLDHILLPSLVTLVEGLAGSKLPAERAHLTDVVARMDQALMAAVLRRVNGVVDGYVAQGFAPGITGGASTGAGTIGDNMQIRPWVFQVLLHLVNVHALCTRVFAPLTPRVLSAAFTSLATSILEKVRKLDANAGAALLQVTVEVEFIHQTLVRFESPPAKEALEATYFTLGGMYRPDAGGSGGKVNEAEVVKRVLSEAIRSTTVMFACFGGVQAEAAASAAGGGDADRGLGGRRR